MKHLSSLRALVITLVLCLITMPLFGFACSKAQRDATCTDVVDTLKGSESAVLNLIPSQRANYLKLESWSTEICAAVKASDNLKAKELIKAFLPVFDDIIGQLGVNQKILALVDIGIHIVLNHLPTNTIVVQSKQGNQSSILVDDSVLIEYKNRVSWGCKFKPEYCK